jgi:hypothetical protein
MLTAVNAFINKKITLQSHRKGGLCLNNSVCRISRFTSYFFRRSLISANKSLSDGPAGAAGAGGVFVLL